MVSALLSIEQRMTATVEGHTGFPWLLLRPRGIVTEHGAGKQPWGGSVMTPGEGALVAEHDAGKQPWGGSATKPGVGEVSSSKRTRRRELCQRCEPTRDTFALAPDATVASNWRCYEANNEYNVKRCVDGKCSLGTNYEQRHELRIHWKTLSQNYFPFRYFSLQALFPAGTFPCRHLLKIVMRTEGSEARLYDVVVSNRQRHDNCRRLTSQHCPNIMYTSKWRQHDIIEICCQHFVGINPSVVEHALIGQWWGGRYLHDVIKKVTLPQHIELVNFWDIFSVPWVVSERSAVINADLAISYDAYTSRRLCNSQL